MASISVTISIEGDPEESISALRRIAGVGNRAQPAGSTDDLPHVAAEPYPESPTPLPTASQMPSRYQHLWENGAGRTTRGRQSAPETPPRPAQWDRHLCNELVNNMTDGARRLVALLAGSGVDGVTREALTAQLNIPADTIRTTQVSIGHALRRVQRDNGNISLPRPVEFHKAINTYMLNPDFRAGIQETA